MNWKCIRKVQFSFYSSLKWLKCEKWLDLHILIFLISNIWKMKPLLFIIIIFTKVWSKLSAPSTSSKKLLCMRKGGAPSLTLENYWSVKKSQCSFSSLKLQKCEEGTILLLLTFQMGGSVQMGNAPSGSPHLSNYKSMRKGQCLFSSLIKR